MVSVTVKVATPEALVVAGEVVMTEWPVPWAREIDRPEAGTPTPSLTVTVTVELATPSASTEDGEAEAVEVPADPAPASVSDIVAGAPSAEVNTVAARVPAVAALVTFDACTVTAVEAGTAVGSCRMTALGVAEPLAS